MDNDVDAAGAGLSAGLIKSVAGVLLLFWMTAGAACHSRVPTSKTGIDRYENGEKVALRFAVAEVTSSNCLIMGTNVFSMAAFTNHIMLHGHSIDAVALHGDRDRLDYLKKEPGFLDGLLATDTPVIMDENDEDARLGAGKDPDGVYTLDLRSDYWDKIRGKKKSAPNRGGDPAKPPAVHAELRWHAETGLYDLKKVELGILGRHFWVVVEQNEEDDRATTGLQFRKEW